MRLESPGRPKPSQFRQVRARYPLAVSTAVVIHVTNPQLRIKERLSRKISFMLLQTLQYLHVSNIPWMSLQVKNATKRHAVTDCVHIENYVF